MTYREFKVTLLLSLIFAVRLLGMFIILPVFTPYAHELTGASHLTIGLALGIYGLTQACLQMPFGLLSDRYGRKPMIALGLCFFIAGSAVAALGQHIVTVILGRALQGAGAVGSVISALVADTTTPEHRSQAMALIGISVGLAFMASLVLGPALHHLIDVDGIFWFTAALGVAALGLLSIVPTPDKTVFDQNVLPVPALLRQAARHVDLRRLNLGICTLHALLTANFIALPILLQHHAGVTEAEQWSFYWPILLGACIVMVPGLMIAERQRRHKTVLLMSIAALALAEFALAWLPSTATTLRACLFVFFAAFTLLEASLPAWVSRIAPAGSKGTAMGLFSSSQFFGSFLGGSLGGVIYGSLDAHGIFFASGIASLFWLLTTAAIQQPPHYGTRSFRVSKHDDDLPATLMATPGVVEAQVTDTHAYLRIDASILDHAAFRELCRKYQTDVPAH